MLYNDIKTSPVAAVSFGVMGVKILRVSLI